MERNRRSKLALFIECLLYSNVQRSTLNLVQVLVRRIVVKLCSGGEAIDAPRRYYSFGIILPSMHAIHMLAHSFRAGIAFVVGLQVSIIILKSVTMA